jgi:pyridoxine kinase
MSTPRVAAIHDLSGFGRCSLTVALPILSAMGAQCCPLPTAFLSTHTGGFQDFTFLDMTREISKVTRHWKSLDLQFDAIYSGFMSSTHQIGLVEYFFQAFRTPNTIAVVDPVMGDHGKVYQTYTKEMCQAMARLTLSADVITPNLTEAALLLDVPYDALPSYGEVVERLSLEGKRSVVLTGVSLSPGMTGAMCYDSKSNRIVSTQTQFIAHEFHGTGDVFASVLTGALVQGENLLNAAAKAAEFVRLCAERTAKEDTPIRDGVEFEPLLGFLTDKFLEK